MSITLLPGLSSIEPVYGNDSKVRACILRFPDLDEDELRAFAITEKAALETVSRDLMAPLVITNEEPPGGLTGGMSLSTIDDDATDDGCGGDAELED